MHASVDKMLFPFFFIGLFVLNSSSRWYFFPPGRHSSNCLLWLRGVGFSLKKTARIHTVGAHTFSLWYFLFPPAVKLDFFFHRSSERIIICPCNRDNLSLCASPCKDLANSRLDQNVWRCRYIALEKTLQMLIHSFESMFANILNLSFEKHWIYQKVPSTKLPLSWGGVYTPALASQFIGIFQWFVNSTEKKDGHLQYVENIQTRKVLIASIYHTDDYRNIFGVINW